MRKSLSPRNTSAKSHQSKSPRFKSHAPRGGQPAKEGGGPGARKDFINVPKAGRMVMGDHAIREAFQVNPKSLETLVLLDNWKDSENLRELEALGREKKLKIETRSSMTMDRMGSHQGALLVAKDQPSIELEDLLGLEDATIVALDGVEDPHNLGAVLRTCWLMGVKAVLIPEDRAVGLTPVVHKVAAGGAEHVPIIRDNNFASVFESLQEAGYWIFGLSHRAKGLIYDLAIPRKVVWVLGAEDKGLRTSTEKVCDELIRFPQIEASASYNVSVAAAMTLSESHRQMAIASRTSKNPAHKD